MAEEQVRYYILFANYEQGLALHDLLDRENIPNRIAPAPRAIQGELSCGMSLLIQPEALDQQGLHSAAQRPPPRHRASGGSDQAPPGPVLLRRFSQPAPSSKFDAVPPSRSPAGEWEGGVLVRCASQGSQLTAPGYFCVHLRIILRGT